MKTLEGSYNFQESEKKWQKFWEDNKTYKWNNSEKRENSFVIDTPPPTVSGQLHMGHLFSYTQTDFIARYKRMKGMNIFYPMGFDDNGLPTERLVEKQKNIRAVNTDREEFIKICEDVIEVEEQKFQDLFTSMALSVDWDLKYQSISKNSTKISQLSFLDLVKKGEIYRTEQPVLWDPVDQTALAQADIEDKEKDSEMHDIAFKDELGNNLVIATTRPELLPACVAIFYNPSDSRYTHLNGKFAYSPLFKAKVPILADDSVNIEKGTGLVMCCTFGDATDIVWWQTHKLPLKIILDKTGRIKDSVKFDSIESNEIFQNLVGCKVNEARSKIVAILKEHNLLLKSVPIKHTVKCAERSGAPLEIITTPQWFIKTISHKSELLKRSEELNWYPKSMKIKLDNWINSIAWDWCISRQRFFGVPFPVWYSKRAGEEGKPIFANPNSLPINPIKDLPEGYSKDEVIPDFDVMDTWATSAVSPQLSSFAINDEFNIDIEKHKKLFPFDLRPQAHEILRTWAFYTILKSHLHENILPWKNIMISGWCLAEDKTKMSKSKGNIISPVSLIETYGSDVIRYWASTSKLGADTAFSEELLKLGKKLVNKIWNASKFASAHFTKINIQNHKLEDLVNNKIITHTTDLWLISKLQKTVVNATNAFEKFEYADAVEFIEEFFWKDFCDNYLEISKSRCYDEHKNDPKGQVSAIHTLYHSLKFILKLFAPFIPHITDEIYTTIFDSESIHSKDSWPEIDSSLFNSESIKTGDNLVIILDLVRKAKSAKNLSMKSEVKTLVIPSAQELSDDSASDLKNVTNAQNIIFSDENFDYFESSDDKNNKIFTEF
jgi:valyl-tRNA synthetase